MKKRLLPQCHLQNRNWLMKSKERFVNSKKVLLRVMFADFMTPSLSHNFNNNWVEQQQQHLTFCGC